MGACASKPKTKDILPASITSEVPESFKKAEGEAVSAAPETNNEAEAQKEEPLVEPSKPVVEAVEVVDKEAKAPPEQMATALAPVEGTAAPTPVEVAAAEKQASACKTEADEGEEAVVESVKQKAADVVNAETKKPEATPSSGPKADAPLITTV